MLPAVINRLKAIQVDAKPLFKDVFGALEYANLDRKPLHRYPAAFVLPLDYNPQPDVRGSGPALQNVNHSIGVVVVLNASNSQLGGNDIEPLEAARTAVREQLFGWQASSQLEPFTLGNGRLLHINQGAIFWLDTFHTETYEDANA